MEISHLNNIGFLSEQPDDLRYWIDLIIPQSRLFYTPTGGYLHWAPGNGIELWLRIDRRRKITGIFPHFFGESRTQVGLEAHLMDYDPSSRERGFYGWVQPELDSYGEVVGLFPLSFVAPDYDMHRTLVLPNVQTVQFAIFAHTLLGFDTIEEFHASTLLPFPISERAFFPEGASLYDPEEGSRAATGTSSALFTGQVQSLRQVMNPLTGEDFYTLRVDTLGGQVDVLATPDLYNRHLHVGGVIYCEGCLSGRIIP